MVGRVTDIVHDFLDQRFDSGFIPVATDEHQAALLQTSGQ